jgi:hypothetical protein
MKRLAELLMASLLMAGCTTEAWYEGMRQVSPSRICLDRG